MCIILFGVMLAWVCAWKAKHYADLEQYVQAAAYCALVVILLVIVFIEAVRVTP
jgi:hypothetical protein